MIDRIPMLIDELAEKKGLPRAKVAKAVLSQFKHTAHIMGDDTFRSIRIPYLGSFQVMDKKLRTMQKMQVSGKIPPERISNRPDHYPHLDLDDED